jgi:hypothetical protein
MRSMRRPGDYRRATLIYVFRIELMSDKEGDAGARARYAREVTEARAFILLNGDLPTNAKVDAEVGLAITAATTLSCLGPVRALDRCWNTAAKEGIADPAKATEACQKVHASLSECVTEQAPQVLEKLGERATADGHCGDLKSALDRFGKDAHESQEFLKAQEAFFSCSARRFLDTIVKEANYGASQTARDTRELKVVHGHLFVD